MAIVDCSADRKDYGPLWMDGASEAKQQVDGASCVYIYASIRVILIYQPHLVLPCTVSFELGTRRTQSYSTRQLQYLANLTVQCLLAKVIICD